MITDEMVEKAAAVWTPFWSHRPESRKAILKQARAALEAVEPLIRKQVLKDELSLGPQWQVEDPRMSYVDVQVDKDTYIEVFGKDGGY